MIGAANPGAAVLGPRSSGRPGGSVQGPGHRTGAFCGGGGSVGSMGNCDL